MHRSLPLLRYALGVALFVAAMAVFAQGAATPVPSNLEPLPEIPPPPEQAGDPELEPQITIKRKDSETVEEARVNGQLIWIKVTPRHGRSYYLIPDGGSTRYVRRDSLSGLKVPMWLLFEF